MFSSYGQHGSEDDGERDLGDIKTVSMSSKRRYYPSSSPSPSPPLSLSCDSPPLSSARDTHSDLLALLSCGMQHVPAFKARDTFTGRLLTRKHIDDILSGDTFVLALGEKALSGPAPRPPSATRAIAACPTRYGASGTGDLPSAMALAHAHCTMHDLFACDARLADSEAYHEILAPFVTALTDWPSAVSRTYERPDPHVFELLDMPQLNVAPGGFALCLRSEAVHVTIRERDGQRRLDGMSLVPRMQARDVLWQVSHEHPLNGWFPWLFVEPLSLWANAAEAQVRIFAAMRMSLGIHARLHDQARRTRPATCAQRNDATRIAYGLQATGVAWHFYAMTDEDEGQFPVTTIWSGRVENPSHMAKATAILRQIGTEAKLRLNQVRNWLSCMFGGEHVEGGPKPVPQLPPGLPIPGATASVAPNNDRHLAIPGDSRQSPVLLLPSPILGARSSNGLMTPRPSSKASTQPPTREPSPLPTWSFKPWVEPFCPQPQRARPATAGPHSVSRSASACPSPAPPLPVPGYQNQHLDPTVWPRPASAVPLQKSEQMSLGFHPQGPPPPYWAPRHPVPPPRSPAAASWPAIAPQPTPQPPLMHPTPQPFQYSSNYNYSWTLPPTEPSVQPGFGSASVLAVPSNHATAPQGSYNAPVWAPPMRAPSVVISHPMAHSRQPSYSSSRGGHSRHPSGASSRVHSRQPSGNFNSDNNANSHHASSGTMSQSKPTCPLTCSERQQHSVR